MRKLSLYILAAGVALVAAPAFAQGARPGPGHGPRPSAGHWRGGGMTGMPAHRPNMRMHHRGGRFMHPGRNFRHHRMNRGFVIHPFWFGSQFHINNWQMYGFGDPGADGRWVRYYDDAYLIGRDGRVRDYRYGMDWDRYGEEWDMDDGIPAYRGSRDYRPGDEDYEWAERHDDDDDDDGHDGRGEHRGGHHGGHMMGGPGYGHGAAYGGYYGYGFYAYPIVIETVTTSGGGYSEEIVEEYVEVRHRARPHRRARPRCVCAPAPRPVVRRPAPRPAPPRRPPPAGERG